MLLAAAAWAQQVAVPQGGSLGPSCNLSDATTLGADKLDGSHGAATPTANAVPVANGNGRLAAGWIPLPTTSSIGGIFIDADCLAGNHVNGIDLATGRLKCSADSGGGGLGGTVTANRILLAATSSSAGDSSMTENSGDITSTKAVKAPSFQGTATSDQSITLPAVTSETVSGSGQAKLIAKNNQFQVSVNGGPFAAVGANLPPGSNMQLPYNNNGAWGVLSGYTINPATGEVAVPGPVTTTGTSQIANISESTVSNAVAGKGKVQFNSSTHRPAYCYDGTTLPCSDNVLQADASVTSAANKIAKLDASGKLDDTVLPAPTPTTLGGVMSKSAETNKVLTAIGTDGSVSNAYLPVPTTSLRGGVYMPAGCSTGYHVYAINGSTGELQCTADAGGGGGSGAFSKIYDTRFTTQRAAISATTMVTPGADTTYQFSASVTQQDVGTGCTANATGAVKVTYTDAYTSNSLTLQLSMARGDGTTNVLYALNYQTIGQVSFATANPLIIRAKASTAVQFQTTYTAGANCTTAQAYNFTPLLLQVN